MTAPFLPDDVPSPTTSRRPVALLVAAATPTELAWAGRFGFGTTLGRWNDLPLAFAVTGPGPGAAHFLGAALERVDPALLLSVGVGGGFARAGVTVGEIAVATEENDVDLGVEATPFPDPLTLPAEAAPAPMLGVRFPAEPTRADALLAAAARLSLPARSGPFVTSATVTATAARAEALHSRYQALCESMEGMAAARAAALLKIPFAEVRGISNLVGPRERGAWRIEEAARAAGAVAAAFLDDLAAKATR